MYLLKIYLLSILNLIESVTLLLLWTLWLLPDVWTHWHYLGSLWISVSDFPWYRNEQNTCRHRGPIFFLKVSRMCLWQWHLLNLILFLLCCWLNLSFIYAREELYHWAICLALFEVLRQSLAMFLRIALNWLVFSLWSSCLSFLSSWDDSPVLLCVVIITFLILPLFGGNIIMYFWMRRIESHSIMFSLINKEEQVKWLWPNPDNLLASIHVMRL